MRCCALISSGAARTAALASRLSSRTPYRGNARRCTLAPQDPQHLFEFHAHLAHDLLALRGVAARFIARELVASTTDREALVVQQTADLTDDDDILPLVVAAIATPLHRFELRKFLLPVAQHVRLHAAELTDLADGEIPLSRYRRQFVIVLCFQHRLRRAL